MEKRNNDTTFVRTDAAKSLTETYVRAIAHRYHYEWRDIKKMRQIATQIRTTVEKEEGFYLLLPEQGKEQKLPIRDLGAEKQTARSRCAGVALTLGNSLDALQETYTRQEDIEGAYMIEVIAGELMRNAYLQFSDYIMEHTCYEVGAFHFFGSRPELPLADMKELLARLPGAAVTCNEAYCLEPKKSVVFLAELKQPDGRTKKEGQGASIHLCAQCSRKDCAFRE